MEPLSLSGYAEWPMALGAMALLCQHRPQVFAEIDARAWHRLRPYLDGGNDPREAIYDFISTVWRFDKRFTGSIRAEDALGFGGVNDLEFSRAVYSLVYLCRNLNIIDLFLKAYVPLLRPGIWSDEVHARIVSTFLDDVMHLLYDVQGMEEAGSHESFDWRANRNDLNGEQIAEFLHFAGLPSLEDPNIPPQDIWIIHTNVQTVPEAEYIGMMQDIYDEQDGKPKPKQVVWEDLEREANFLFTIYGGREQGWVEEAWGYLADKGLTAYETERDRTLVLLRLFALAEFYWEFCANAWDERHEIYLSDWACELELDPFRVAQLAGPDFHIDDDCDDLTGEAVLMLVCREAPHVIAALVEGFGSVDELFVALWYSHQDIEKLLQDGDEFKFKAMDIVDAAGHQAWMAMSWLSGVADDNAARAKRLQAV